MSGLKSYLFWMKYFDIETVPVQSIIAVIAVGPPHHSMVPLPRIVLDLFCREMPPPPYFLRQEMSPPPFLRTHSIPRQVMGGPGPRIALPFVDCWVHQHFDCDLFSGASWL